MLEQYKKQLEEFRKDDEVRWQYEEEQVERQLRILEEVGRSDEYRKAELKKAGIDVAELEKHSEEEAKKEKRAFEELRKIDPPPLRRGQKESILIRRSAALAGSHTWLFPPAYVGWGNAEQCGFNLALAEINTARDMTGDGWGLAAVGYGTQYCTLWFY
jgi:hypothetical protein